MFFDFEYIPFKGKIYFIKIEKLQITRITIFHEGRKLHVGASKKNKDSNQSCKFEVCWMSVGSARIGQPNQEQTFNAYNTYYIKQLEVHLEN